MNKFFILFMCIVTNTSAFAKSLADWQKAIVKVSSYPCQAGRPRFDGSGFLVSYQGDTYVLTSEHVVLHDSNDHVCHEIQNEKETINVKLLSADCAKGMALLKIAKY